MDEIEGEKIIATIFVIFKLIYKHIGIQNIVAFAISPSNVELIIFGL